MNYTFLALFWYPLWRVYIGLCILACPLDALRLELVVPKSSEKLGEDYIGVLRHYILFYICLHYLHKLGPFVPLNPPFEGLDGIGVLLNAVDLHFPSSLLAGTHQFR